MSFCYCGHLRRGFKAQIKAALHASRSEEATAAFLAQWDAHFLSKMKSARHCLWHSNQSNGKFLTSNHWWLGKNLNLPLKPRGSCSLNNDGLFWNLHSTLPEGNYFRLTPLRLILGQRHSLHNDLTNLKRPKTVCEMEFLLHSSML